MLTNLASVPSDFSMHARRMFDEDQRAEKINLGIGVYYDDDGCIPLLKAVQKADRRLHAQRRPWAYLPAEDLRGLREGPMLVVFGEQASLEAERTSATQTLGGTGALRSGAEIIKTLIADTKVFVIDPSWPNHRVVFQSVGLDVGIYRYHTAATGRFDLGEMIADLEAAPRGAVTILHAFSFIKSQRGLFSFSMLSRAQIDELRVRHAIHTIEDGRLYLAALNTQNLDRVATAMRDVTTTSE